MRMQRKVVLITGAGRGIGRAAALLLAQEGANVVLNSEVPEEIDAVAGEVQALGRRALAVVADMMQEDQVERLARMALAEMGRIDALIQMNSRAAARDENAARTCAFVEEAARSRSSEGRFPLGDCV